MKKTILALLAAFLIVFPVVFWALDAIPPTPGLILYNLSQLFALVGFNLLTMQFLLTSRIPLLEKGLGQDRLFRIHRRFGIFGFAAVAVHGILYTTWELVNSGTISVSVLKTLGVVGLVLVALIAVVAMYHDRLGMKYETWKNIHRLTFLILPMVFIHSILLGSTLNRTPALRIQWFVLIGLYALVVIYRAAVLVWIRRHPFTVAAVDQETHDTWTLAFDGPRPKHYPGQFLFVNLVRNGKVSESHPYTISSSPTSERFTITPKSIGDFSSSVKDTSVGDKAYIEAPFGVFSYLNSSAQKLAFIAGGIGITPFMSMLRHMRDTGTTREVVLIWGNKSEDDIAFADELKAMEDSMESFRTHHVLSHDDWKGKTPFTGEKGFVDAEKVSNYLGSPADYEIYVCGPPVMMAKLIPALEKIGVPPSQIRSERFAL